jgi:hypothetical protein
MILCRSCLQGNITLIIKRTAYLIVCGSRIYTGYVLFYVCDYYLYRNAACAAAKRAIGTRKGEQLT